MVLEIERRDRHRVLSVLSSLMYQLILKIAVFSDLSPPHEAYRSNGGMNPKGRNEAYTRMVVLDPRLS